MLWAGQNSFAQAIQIITNVFDLVVMYGAAGFGWILYITIPSAVSAILNIIAQRRISRLRNLQRDLISEWGKKVGKRPVSEMSEESHVTDKDLEPV